MIRLFTILALLFVLAHAAASQTVDCPQGKVCIDQPTANKLFDAVQQLIAAKDVIAKMTAERSTSDATIASANKVIETYKQLESVNNEIIAKKDLIIQLYEQVIKTQQTMIDNYITKLNKPKSAWEKFLTTLKEIALIAGGMAIGRHF